MKTLHIVESMKNSFLKGIGIGAGIGVGLFSTGLLAAALSMNIFSPGEVISSSKINQNFAIAAPEGAVVAFDLSECPAGWVLADGTNGTHDLRGRFVRGLDERAPADGGMDPQGPRSVGQEQTDAFQGHYHWRNISHGVEHDMRVPSDAGTQGLWAGTIHGLTQSYTGSAVTDGAYGSARVASETRPRNVSLIYCMRKN